MRSGGSITPVRTVLALFAFAGGLLTAGRYPAAENQGSTASDAVIAGTVFRDPGFALPGAEVTLVPDPEDPAKLPKKIKKQRTSTSMRGEFVFHVPADPMRYRISASAKNYKTQEKPVMVQGEGRTDVTLTLTQESKK
jgi:hypothetical protein